MDSLTSYHCRQSGETISQATGAEAHAEYAEYEDLKNAEDDGAEARWRNRLTWVNTRHAINKELTMYPAIEKYLGEGGRAASKNRQETSSRHQELSRRIQVMTPTNPKFWPLLGTLMNILYHHMEH